MRTGLRCLVGLIVMMFFAVRSEAQLTKIFVASFGNDANDGSRGSPKRNFQAAHDAVAAGGEVVALDTAGYGALTITKSVGITAPAGITGFITTSGGTNAVTLNAAASDQVSLRGLTINAVNVSGTPIGVLINTVGTLSVSNCTISGYDQGIRCAPTTDARVVLTSSTVRGSVAPGFLLPFGGSASVRLIIDRCELVSNGGDGLSVNGSTVSGVTHRVEIRDSLIANNKTNGLFSNGVNITTVLQGCAFAANSFGINVQVGASVKVDGCVITANTTKGIQFGGTGAALLSRGNNTVEDNATDGTFSGTYSAK